MSQQLFAENTPIAIVLALAILSFLTWRVKSSTFRSLSWQSVGIASALFWGLLAALLVATVWQSYYSFFMPAGYRLAAPLVAMVVYSFGGLILRWAALHLPGNPILWFCLLGGLESIPEHAIAIYGYGILESPQLRGSSALSIFIFAYFEYVVFWGIALALAIGLDRLRRAFQHDADHSQTLPKDASG